MSFNRMSWRRILAKELQIFNATGKPMTLLLVQDGDGNVEPQVDDLINKAQPIPAQNLYPIYVYGKFEETDVQAFGNQGFYRRVVGVITIPLLFKSQLAAAAYIDPYNDGSRFKKAGAIVNEGRLFCIQTIESEFLATTGDIV